MALFEPVDWKTRFVSGVSKLLSPQTWSRPPVSEVKDQINAEISELDRDIINAVSDSTLAAGEVPFAEDQRAALQNAERLESIAERLKKRRKALALQLDGVAFKERCEGYDAETASMAKEQERIVSNTRTVLEKARPTDEILHQAAAAFGELEIAASGWLSEIVVHRDLSSKVWVQPPAAAYQKLLGIWAPPNPFNASERVVMPGGNKFYTDPEGVVPYSDHVAGILELITEEFAKANEVRASQHPRKFRKPENK